MEIPEKVVMITANDTFRRIASHCALRLENYRINHELGKEELPNVFLPFFKVFSIDIKEFDNKTQDDFKDMFALGVALQKEVWDHRDYLKSEGVALETILYDFNCQLHLLKHEIKK